MAQEDELAKACLKNTKIRTLFKLPRRQNRLPVSDINSFHWSAAYLAAPPEGSHRGEIYV